MNHRETYYKNNAIGSRFVAKKWHDHRIRVVLDIVNSLNVKSLLDIGAGDGTIIAQTKVQNKTALEINKNWIDKLNKLSDVKVVNGDILDKNLFSENSFELVLATEVLEHFPYYDLTEVLKNVRKITSKYFVVCVPNPVSLMGRLSAVVGRFRWQQISLDHAFLGDSGQWSEIFKNSGFVVLKTVGASMKIPKIFKPGLWVTKPIKYTLADFLIFLLEKK